MFAKAFMIAATLMVQSSPATPSRPGLVKAPAHTTPAAPAGPTGFSVALEAPAPETPVPTEPVSVAGELPTLAIAPRIPSAPGGSHISNERVAANSADAATAAVTKVQAFYKATRQFSAVFRQTYTNKAFGQKSVKDGKVYIKKPGKMRWDYKGRKGLRSSFVSDGDNAWMVEFENRQYAHQKLTDSVLPVAISFLYGKGDLLRDFTASTDKTGTYGSRSDIVVRLVPKRPSAQYKMLYLVVDPGNYRVKQSIVIEGNGNSNHFRFYEPNISRAIADKTFVVNTRELSRRHFRRINPKKAKRPAGAKKSK